MDLSRYAELFVAETREHIATVHDRLLALERGEAGAGAVDELFRAVHTMKGMAATMGYGGTAELAHGIEHLLDHLRQGAGAVDAPTVDLLLEAVDALEAAASQESAGGAAPATTVLERLAAGTASLGTPDAAPAAPEQAPVGTGRLVTVTFDADCALPAARALLALRRARALGEVSAVAPSEATLAVGSLIGPLRFRLDSDAPPESVEAAVRGAGEVESVEVERPAPAAAAPAPPAETGAQAGGIVRIRQQRLDAVLDGLGELIVARNRLARAALASPDPELVESVEAVSRLVSEMQEEIMQLRMVPVGEVFDRFPRLVRDAARSLDRQVELELRGREQEVDRSLLAELGESLVHLLRNAVDHGIEPPAERLAAGKPAAGRLVVTAVRSPGSLEVRVEDDGRGVRRDRVVEVAVRRGLVSAERAAALDDQEVIELLTRPGFSTAARLTDVSGRGVGLDAVRSRLQRLGGTLELRSREGEGTTCTVRLPLTLAIARVLLVEGAGERYALPVASVLLLTEADRAALALAGGELEWRDERLPVLRLGELLRPGTPPPGESATLAVLEVAGERLALEVDRVVGQQDAVLKSFDPVAGAADLFSAATLLADGLPALVLDAARLAARTRERQAAGAD